MKLGTCCHIGSLVEKRNGDVVFEQYAQYKIGTVRVSNVKSLSPSAQYAKLSSKVKANLTALYAQVKYIATLPDNQKMFRISSDILPLHTHLEYRSLYDDKLNSLISDMSLRIGKVVKDNDIRISTHPSQFITISSDRPEVCTNAIRDLESAKWMFEQMGLQADEVSINIHTNGRSFTLPDEASHLFPWLTLENDEKQAGFWKTLDICEKYGIRMVLDLHHYYCENDQTYLSVDSDEFKRVLGTWNGKRPYFHISQSRGYESKRDMMAHSQMITDDSLIAYLRDFLEYGDCEVEAKHKNVAVEYLVRKLQIS